MEEKNIDFDTYLKSKDRIDFDAYMKGKGQDVINEFYIDSLKLLFASMNVKYKNSKEYSNLKTFQEWKKELEIHINSLSKDSVYRDLFINIVNLPPEKKVNAVDMMFDVAEIRGKNLRDNLKLKKQQRANGGK
jgi:hypothetical protein